MKKILLIFIAPCLILLLASCQQSKEVLSYKVVLKDLLEVYDTPNFKGAKPIDKLPYGTIVEVLKTSEQLQVGVIKISPVNSSKIYYALEDNLYPLINKIKIKGKDYYIIKEGVIHWQNGGWLFTKLYKDDKGLYQGKDSDCFLGSPS